MSTFNGSPRRKKGARAPGRKECPLLTHHVDLKADSPKIREMERSAATRRGFKWAIGIVILICLFVLVRITVREAFLKNPQFELRQVAVRTEGPLTPEKIVRTTGLTEGTNLLTINLRTIRTRLQHLPQVKSVVIERDYTGLLSLNVKQRQPVAWLVSSRLPALQNQRGPTGYLVDADAVAFPCETDGGDYGQLPLIRFEGLSQGTVGVPLKDLPLQSALMLLRELERRDEDGKQDLRALDIQTPYSMTALFSDQSQIIFGVDDLEFQLARLDRVRREARQRQWQIESLNLLVRQNVPVTFRQPPDLAGLQEFNVPIATLPRDASHRTSR